MSKEESKLVHKFYRVIQNQGFHYFKDSKLSICFDWQDSKGTIVYQGLGKQKEIEDEWHYEGFKEDPESDGSFQMVAE